METSAIDNSLASRMGVSCHSPVDQWPSPPVAHAHHSSGSTFSNSTTNHNNINSTNYMAFGSPGSDNENSNSMMSDCQSTNSGTTTNNTNDSNNNTSNTSSSNSSIGGGNPRQNHVGSIMLHGVAIVSLVIDNKERLCLAQISNTLLKDYSYNEIHNRRVALGITCVQCTPVQLEILRRAGAMPVSSRRCGMITKREAERLVKSFLEENAPPKLPEDFAFNVYHECGWGCRGYFEPSRYNSSRAKCIKCSYCNMYFSPNKFIFHFHRTPESKYNHPDAANFNSWRRHLKLCSEHDKEEISYKWEDVKAMFNGGTRKRIFTSASSSSSTTSSLSTSLSSTNHSSVTYTGRSPSHNGDAGSGGKKAKTAAASPLESNPYLPKPPPFSNPFNPYNWLTAAPGKSPYPFMAMNSSQSMCFGFPPPASPNKDAMAERMKASPIAPPSWLGRTAPAGPFSLSSMDLFWDKAFGFPQATALNFRNTGYPSPALPGAAATSHPAVTSAILDNPDHLSAAVDSGSCISPPQNLIKNNYERGEKIRDRMSAFKRVVPSTSSPPSSLSPSHSTHDDSDRPGNDFRQGEDDADNDEENMYAQDLSTHKDVEESEEIDVEEDADERKRKGVEECDKSRTNEDTDVQKTTVSESGRQSHEQSDDTCDEKSENGERSTETSELPPSPLSELEHKGDNDRECSNAENSDEQTGQDSGLSDESDTDTESQKTFLEMSKEELCQTLKSEVECRRRREKEVHVLKETFREEVNREKSFREHMAQQLEMLRETLTNELEQERKIRFSLQQKLKEAHDALQNFSCGLLTGRRDSMPMKDAGVVPR